MGRRIRDRLSYANVMATVAVFLALGGGAYALTLPRNSVGSAQLRSDSVGRPELRRNAVISSAINDRTIRLRDISRAARKSLGGQTGPAGPPGPPGTTFFAAIDSGGGRAAGNAVSANRFGVNGRLVEFAQPVTSCVATATLATVPGGGVVTPPPTAHVTVAPTSDGKVLVQTWNSAGGAVAYPFNLIVAC